jgi:hypothetical protein
MTEFIDWIVKKLSALFSCPSKLCALFGGTDDARQFSF